LGARFLNHLAVLFFWGLLQHYGLQSLVNRRLQSAWGPGWKSIWITAGIFSALHLPNPTLAVATLIGGYFWASAFQRHPNLIAIALTHALLSALLANSFPKEVLPNMKVGWGFF
jgi:membrane protease YdiL (CAAX protease family)